MLETQNKAERSKVSRSDGPLWLHLSPPHFVVLGGLIIACVMVGLCALVLYQGRDDAMARARENSTNLALMAERDIERNFELYDLSLLAVVDGVNRPDVMALPDRLRRDVLFDRAATANYLGSMLVLDADGNIVMDASGQRLAFIYFEDEPVRRSSMKRISKADAWQLARAIVRIPGLLQRD